MTLDKTNRMNYLIDFYQELLTPKQRNYMSLYYLDDFSLGEIADEFEVSRQAVYDNIKRTEAMLEQYEERLSLFQKYERRKILLEELKQLDLPSEALVAIESLEQLE
ncbi:putative DNA-binding protein [Exiguobacterium sp. s193]|uniref:putative DNA-binding protein n=1 Tax=Exiguobacterium sp. s193 TaxID=2751207 RepID=UPI001BEA66A4|nr:putative DNA-binding protein [Exiguobacterium sp. s193]